MRAGLLANIILGESPYLKSLVRHFNLIVLDTQGKITGFNSQFLQTSRKREEDFLHQPFVRIFDSDEGKAHLQLSIKQAFTGKPGAIQFYQFDNRVSFQGVILPVYDHGHTPSSLIVLAKEEKRTTVVRPEEIENFWERAQKMMEEAGIAVNGQPINAAMENTPPKLILVEDKVGIIPHIFKNMLNHHSENLILAPSTEAALEWSGAVKPQRIISTYFPKGCMEVSDLAVMVKQQFEASLILLTSYDHEIRIEDGWLDIHFKKEAATAEKIIELVSRIY